MITKKIIKRGLYLVIILYDNYTSGNELLRQNVTLTTDANGVYNVLLSGINTSFPAQYYLGITVGTDSEASPRINLSATPYTFRANISESLQENLSYKMAGLNVTGFSITNDSLVTLSNGSKKKIKDIKAGEEVLTLDEKTGKLVPRKVNALLDQGIKQIYEMTTESGKAINTTAEHPYFVKRTNSDDLIGNDLNLPSSFNSIKNPSKSSGLDLFLSKIENDSNKALGLSCGILNQTTENILFFWNFEKSAKCLSFVTNTLCSDLDNSANIPFESFFGLNTTSSPCCLRNPNNSFLTFSSSRNFSFFFDTNDDIITTSGDDACIMQGCFDMLSSEGCLESCKNFFNRHATFKHLQDLPDHDSCSLESRSSAANFAVRNNILVNFNSHNNDNNNVVYKDYGKWIEVRYLKVGDEIAVPDYQTGSIKWKKITSIKVLPPQHVYD